MKRKINGGVDWISELPEGIIHRIMSQLSSEEVARTCVLSKTWYRLKRNYPVLEFELPRLKDGDNSDYLIKFNQVVYNSLQHFGSNEIRLQAFSMNINIIGRLNLYGFFYQQPNRFRVDKICSDLDSWIRLALEKGVQELKICALIYTAPDYFTLPQPLFCSKTLTTLKLTGCVLDLPISIFSSLRKLNVSKCFLGCPIILKDTDCPVLEHLTVNCCSGPANFMTIYISRLLRLNTFVINNTYCSARPKVEVSSPSIQSVSIVCPWITPWSAFINIHGCNRLKSLYLDSKQLTDAELHSLLLSLPLLEELYIFECRCLRTVKISSPLLKTLEICCEPFDSCLIHIEVSSPNLENFIYKAVKGPTSTSKSPRIKVADCCHSLKTLVLYGYLFSDKTLQNLLYRFPLLENLWIIDCHRLRRINVPNLQLERLHIVRCDELKAVKVSSPNLCEFCCTDCEVPKFSVADDVSASGLKVECGVHSSSRECLLRLKEMMKSFFVHLKEERFYYEIIDVGNF